jgi:tetratricopeptide (TPR) repeat protein
VTDSPATIVQSTNSGPLLDRLAAWEESFRRGGDPTPEELCGPAAADLVEPLRAAIRKRKQLLALLHTPADDAEPLPELPGLTVLGRIGRGGMGVVYRAVQADLGRAVAVKMIAGPPAADPAAAARFRSEALALAKLRHPNIVQVHDVGSAGGRPYLVLELLGESLSAVLRDAPLPPQAAAAVVEAVARAVQHAHDQGILHRDLKPANILFANAKCGMRDAESKAGLRSALRTPHSELLAKVADFGLVKHVGTVDGLTQTGAVMGTPSYMAPEQAGGDSKHVGPAADVYALGAVLYECLTGRPPFRAPDAFRTVHMVLTEDPVSPRSLDGTIPRDLETVALKCLQKDPRKRYPSAAALADDLGRFLAGRPITARAVGPAERLWKSVRRNKGLSAAVAAVFLALTAGAAVSAWQSVRARAAEAEKQRRLADSYLQQARLRMQRGQWEPALADLDRALAEGHPDPIAVRVDKVRAFFALNRIEAAREELDGLETADGTADLLRADLAVGADNAAAIAHARSALARGLPPAERAHAEGLIATDTAGAEAGFRTAVELEPYHSRANQMLAWLLIVQGRTGEALLHIARARAFFPDDPNLGGLEVMALAAQGRRADAEAAFRRNAGGLSAEGRRLYWAVARLLLDLHDLETVLTYSRLDLDLTIGRAFTAAPPEDGLPPALPNRLGRYLFPPFFERAFGPFGDLFAKTSAIDPMTVYGRLEAEPEAVAQIAEALNESTALFVRGAAYLDRHEWAEARRVLARAVDAPALFKTRRVALTLLAVAEWQLAVAAMGEEQKRWLKEAATHLREVYRDGGTPRFYTAHAIDAAIDCGDLELARRMAADAEAWTPADLGILLRRAHLECRTGNYGGALERYERLRREKLAPADAAALERGVARCRAGIRELGRQYLAPLEVAPIPRPAR